MRLAWYAARATWRRSWRMTLVIAVVGGLLGTVALGALAGARRTDSAYARYLRSVNDSDVMVDIPGPLLPLWVAGAPWTSPPYTNPSGETLPSTSVLAAWCEGIALYAGTDTSDNFAGGTPWILQETPGTLPSPYGIDPDYAC